MSPDSTPRMRVRKCRDSDIPGISRLYFETVRRINSKDYGRLKTEAWAPRIYSDAFWRRRFKHYHVYVAEQDGVITGFAELEDTGYIDCFYVHHRWQGKGVGSMLLKRLQSEARKRKIKQLSADVSITARPFFRKAGFVVVRQQKKIYRNRSFRQFVMHRRV